MGSSPHLSARARAGGDVWTTTCPWRTHLAVSLAAADSIDAVRFQRLSTWTRPGSAAPARRLAGSPALPRAIRGPPSQPRCAPPRLGCCCRLSPMHRTRADSGDDPFPAPSSAGGHGLHFPPARGAISHRGPFDDGRPDNQRGPVCLRIRGASSNDAGGRRLLSGSRDGLRLSRSSDGSPTRRAALVYWAHTDGLLAARARVRWHAARRSRSDEVALTPGAAIRSRVVAAQDRKSSHAARGPARETREAGLPAAGRRRRSVG